MSRKKQYANTLEEHDLHGPVKQVMERWYKAVERDGQMTPGKLHSIPYVNAVISYSPEGFIRERRGHNTAGQLSLVNIHDPAGRLVEQHHYTQEGRVLESRRTIRYDDAGNQMESRTEYPNKTVGRLVISSNVYDEQGRRTEHIETTDGVMTSRSETTYDDDKRTCTSVRFNAQGAPETCYEDTYNEQGEEVISRIFDYDGKCTYDRIIHYNADGQYTGETMDGTHFPHTPSLYHDQDETDRRKNWTKRMRPDQKTGLPKEFGFRTITYYGDESADVVLDFSKVPLDLTGPKTTLPPVPPANPLRPEQWQWLAEGATGQAAFPAPRFYLLMHGCYPSMVTLWSYQSDLLALRNHLLRHFGAAEAHSQSANHAGRFMVQYSTYLLYFPRNRYMLLAEGMQWEVRIGETFLVQPADPDAALGYYIHQGKLRLLMPPEGVAGRDEAFEKELDGLVEAFRIQKPAKRPGISMVVAVSGGFVLQPYPVKDDFEIKDLELNYGAGFEAFDTELLAKLKGQTQGLILFHGAPGTGKTFYIRHLLRRMTEANKEVIYMPPNMVDHLADPAFAAFISGQVQKMRQGGKSCVLLLEDAEPLLATRGENTRIQGITNLLNMTDGLLNDMLGLQVICTFNVGLRKLDPALLRPGRLIARKEFKALEDFEANVLAHSLGVKHTFNGPATLAEVYAMVAGKGTVVHEG